MAASDELDLDLLAASLRADASDLQTFTEVLAAKLEAALPGGVRVYRWRTRLFGAKQVRKITVDAGEQRLELRAEAGTVQTTCARLSGGIVLKSEAIDIDEWLRLLSEVLAAEAQRSQITRQALQRLLDLNG